jgi:hypothetical protein
MYNPYYENGWQSGETGKTPITAAALNNMEEGIRAAHPEQMVIAIPASGWVDKTQTLDVGGIAEKSSVIVAPNPVSFEGYCEAGVYCAEQGTDMLVFKCNETPKETLAVNLLILAEG